MQEQNVQRILYALSLLVNAFSPTVVAQQIFAVVVLSFLYEGITPIASFAKWLLFRFLTHRGKLAQEEKQKLETATSYPEWRQHAKKLQELCQKIKIDPDQKPTEESHSSSASGKGDRRQEAIQVANREAKQRAIYEKWMESLDPGSRNRFLRLQDKTDFYKSLVAMRDVETLKFHLRGELLRKHFGLGSEEITLKSDQCAKQMFDDYMNTVCQALGMIAQTAEEGIKDSNGSSTSVAALEARIEAVQEVLTFFSETRHSFGRSALLLSGGARMGLVHVGVIKALVEQDLMPRIISGASAGSIVTAMLGCYTNDELKDYLFDPNKINLRFFAREGSSANLTEGAPPPAPGTAANAKGIKRSGFNSLFRLGSGSNYTVSATLRVICLILPPPLGDWLMTLAKKVPGLVPTENLLDVHTLAKAIRDSTGDMTFKEAFERTGRIINITVTPQGDRDLPLLLNYLTAPNVLVWSAAVASSAIPGVFAPVELMAKDINGNIVPNFPEGCRWTDGSVESDLPMQRLAELFNVNHTIVSQVNIHARFLAPLLGRYSALHFNPILFPNGEVYKNPFFNILRMIFNVLSTVDRALFISIDYLRDQIRSTIRHIADAGLKVEWLKFVGKGFVPLLTQQYHGDITMFPSWTMESAFKLLQNPTPDEYRRCIIEGEHMTWPYISRIRSRCMIEFMLDDCIHALQTQIHNLNRQLRGTKSPKLSASRTNLVRLRDSSLESDSTTPMNKARKRAPDVLQFMAPSASVLNMANLYSGQSSIAAAKSAPADSVAPASPSKLLSSSSSSSSSLTLEKDDGDLSQIQSKLKLRIRSVADFSTFAQPGEEEEEAEPEKQRKDSGGFVTVSEDQQQ